jgi:hypothetical protein
MGNDQATLLHAAGILTVIRKDMQLGTSAKTGGVGAVLKVSACLQDCTVVRAAALNSSFHCGRAATLLLACRHNKVRKRGDEGEQQNAGALGHRRAKTKRHAVGTGKLREKSETALHCDATRHIPGGTWKNSYSTILATARG